MLDLKTGPRGLPLLCRKFGKISATCYKNFVSRQLRQVGYAAGILEAIGCVEDGVCVIPGGPHEAVPEVSR